MTIQDFINSIFESKMYYEDSNYSYVHYTIIDNSTGELYIDDMSYNKVSMLLPLIKDVKVEYFNIKDIFTITLFVTIHW